MHLTFGTRGSTLARYQTNWVADCLQKTFPDITIETVIFSTKGDRELSKPLPEIGGKGLFTAELEAALQQGTIDLAVHSLKDLPTDDAPGLTIGAILPRENPADVLVSGNGYRLDTLPTNATIGTSSLRRAAQLLAQRPDLKILSLRGNVDTRLQKALNRASPYKAVVMAMAGLSRLQIIRADESSIQFWPIPFDMMLPAPGQGAIAVQCRATDEAILGKLALLNHEPTRQAVLAERAFLTGLGGGCSVPIGALGEIEGNTLTLRGVVADLSGQQVIRLIQQGTPTEAVAIGHELARQALAQGARQILLSKI